MTTTTNTATIHLRDVPDGAEVDFTKAGDRYQGTLGPCDCGTDRCGWKAAGGVLLGDPERTYTMVDLVIHSFTPHGGEQVVAGGQNAPDIGDGREAFLAAEVGTLWVDRENDLWRKTGPQDARIWSRGARRWTTMRTAELTSYLPCRPATEADMDRVELPAEHRPGHPVAEDAPVAESAPGNTRTFTVPHGYRSAPRQLWGKQVTIYDDVRTRGGSVLITCDDGTDTDLWVMNRDGWTERRLAPGVHIPEHLEGARCWWVDPEHLPAREGQQEPGYRLVTVTQELAHGDPSNFLGTALPADWVGGQVWVDPDRGGALLVSHPDGLEGRRDGGYSLSEATREEHGLPESWCRHPGWALTAEFHERLVAPRDAPPAEGDTLETTPGTPATETEQQLREQIEREAAAHKERMRGIAQEGMRWAREHGYADHVRRFLAENGMDLDDVDDDEDEEEEEVDLRRRFEVTLTFQVEANLADEGSVGDYATGWVRDSFSVDSCYDTDDNGNDTVVFGLDDDWSGASFEHISTGVTLLDD